MMFDPASNLDREALNEFYLKRMLAETHEILNQKKEREEQRDTVKEEGATKKKQKKKKKKKFKKYFGPETEGAASAISDLKTKRDQFGHKSELNTESVKPKFGRPRPSRLDPNRKPYHAPKNPILDKINQLKAIPLVPHSSENYESLKVITAEQKPDLVKTGPEELTNITVNLFERLSIEKKDDCMPCTAGPPEVHRYSKWDKFKNRK